MEIDSGKNWDEKRFKEILLGTSEREDMKTRRIIAHIRMMQIAQKEVEQNAFYYSLRFLLYLIDKMDKEEFFINPGISLPELEGLEGVEGINKIRFYFEENRIKIGLVHDNKIENKRESATRV